MALLRSSTQPVVQRFCNAKDTASPAKRRRPEIRRPCPCQRECRCGFYIFRHLKVLFSLTFRSRSELRVHVVGQMDKPGKDRHVPGWSPNGPQTVWPARGDIGWVPLPLGKTQERIYFSSPMVQCPARSFSKLSGVTRLPRPARCADRIRYEGVVVQGRHQTARLSR